MYYNLEFWTITITSVTLSCIHILLDTHGWLSSTLNSIVTEIKIITVKYWKLMKFIINNSEIKLSRCDETELESKSRASFTFLGTAYLLLLLIYYCFDTFQNI